MSQFLDNDEAREIQRRLAVPFDVREVKFKPQQVKGNRAIALCFIDARLIQDRLDEVVGVENWEDCYKLLTDGSVMCRLRVNIGGRWITKMDVGSPSEQPDAGDRLKAAFSDALKRAAVKFGIGRYLYRLSAQWVDYDPVKKQLMQLPQLPAFAVPSNQQKASKDKGPVEQPKPEPKKKEPDNLPKSGEELAKRIRDYDSKLAAAKVSPTGGLVAAVLEAGAKAGYPARMEEWSGPAIPFAVDVVKEYETSRKQKAAG